jgi:DNA-binding NarL/FixJ family response regulator
MKTILDRLTPREKEIASLVAQGKTDKEIAEELHLSHRTVECHVGNMRGKTHLNRVQLAVEVDRLERSN